MDNFLARMIAAADMVISPYAYTVKDHFEHCNIVWLPYSAAIEASAASANIGFNENPICKVLVSGSLAWDRPFRQYAANVKSEHIDVLPHPGYGTRYGDDVPEMIGARYFHELNKYLCCFTDAHKYRYLHLKNFEIASVGSLLLTDKLIEPEMNQLGFVDYETCIFASPDNFVEKVSWICDDRNRETVDQIRRAGMQLVKERHLTRHRARQLNDIVDNVILRESRSRITELQHTERENTAMATQPIDKKTESSKSDSGYEDAPILSRVYMGEDLLKWQVAHAMKVRLWDGGIVVSDSTQYDWHLLRIHDTEFLYRLVRIRCLLKKLATSTKNFYVHHYGLKDVAEIGLDGTIVNNGISRLLSVTPRSGDLLEIEIEYLSCHSTISIGCSSDRHPVYTGSGLEQFIILRIEVETRDATQELSRVPQEERIRIVDVGAAEGLQLKWMLNADRVTPVLFEPISADAETLRQTVGRIPGAVVIESALAHTSGPNKLYVAQASGCSSLREPDFGLLSRYSIGKIFRTIRTEKVNCTRYDELFRQQVAPSPDVIKIDAQGFEYEVLLGFGQLLESCLGIELETHFYPVYRGQRLVGDIVEFLAEFGFVLRALRHVPNFDGDCVEFDAFFTKRRHDVLTFSESVKRKFALLTEIWELAPYF